MAIRGTVRSHEAGPEAFSEKGLSTACTILRRRRLEVLTIFLEHDAAPQ
jgi:hypothetical protein